MRRLSLILPLLFLSCLLRAQFSLTGSDPGKTRWSRMDTESFTIIYPSGEDSLARVYGSWLEKAKVAVSWSSGMRIGEYYKSRTPVTLHSFFPVPNASVTWAPKRMDIYTIPDPYSPTPESWERLLAIHEGRHVSQMQAGAGGRNKVMRFFVGELFAGAVAGIYPGPTLLEGDAVVAETALTESGRGRQASFLSYMAPAFDSGDWRDYWRWSLGSEKYYTPDHYRAGYMLISGMRVFFDDPLFTEEYFSRVKGRGGFNLLGKTVRQASGMSLKKSFREIEERYHAIWTEEAASRGPFMPSERVSLTPWRHTSYSGTVADQNGVLWSVRSGLTRPVSLVRMSPSGEESRVRSFGSRTGSLNLDSAGGRIWWSETLPDVRWSLAGTSRIRYIETSDPSRVRDLTRKGNYFNPAPSPDGKYVCAVEYPSQGGSRLVVMDSGDGTVTRVIQAPDSLQFTEPAWVGNRLFAAGLSRRGMGIYSVSPVKALLEPRPVEMSTLRPYKDEGLTFVCDRTGVNEMYLLDVDSGVLRQVTETRYGISSPSFNIAADTLFYSSLAPADNPGAYKDGWMVYSTPAKDLPMRPVSFNEIHDYPVAAALSAQEKALAGEGWDDFKEYSEASFSEPGRYRKLTPSIHSWAPLYFNYDNIESVSGDDYYKSGSLGATVLFQNLVGDGYGFVGYGAHKDPDVKKDWRHSAHLKYLNNGLPAVFEISADIGDRMAKQITRVQSRNPAKESLSVYSQSSRMSAPFIESYLRAYVPLNFSSGGVSRGLVPQIKLRVTNDHINKKIIIREARVDGNGQETLVDIGVSGEDRLCSMNTVDISARGYVMRDKAPSQVYSSLGIGAEIGLRTRPGLSEYYGDAAYVYIYGYLPGVLQNQGLRVSASYGKELKGGPYSYHDNPASFVPRGFADTSLRTFINARSPEKFRLTLDYAIPVLNLDWSGLCPVAYVKNLVMTPFADLAGGKNLDLVSSVGVDLAVGLGNMLWLPYDSRIGIRYARNSWKETEGFDSSGLDRHFFGLVFDVSL
ncbi:MAG: hypothetical protein IJK05_07090 [Bacteroidales bacterium]|nr:hypothetical protein [Bacteroidales bacterium]